MANEIVYTPSDLFYESSGTGEVFVAMYVGKRTDPYESLYHGACRFTGIAVAQGASIYSATLSYYVSYRGIGSGGNLKTKIYGIDEDNTGTFSSNPRGRTRTTAYKTDTGGMAGTGSYNNFDVKNIINEIVGRGGWSYGNALGFLIDDDGSSDNYWIDDQDYRSRLIIKVNADPNFFPTPKSISAPTFPSASHYGIKISKPGVDVLSATEDELYFTTRKSIVKVIAEGETTTIGGTEKLLAHGLGYTPCVVGFVEVGGKRVKLNRDIGGSVDPIGSGLTGYIGADDTYISIITNANANVYYYVFIDPLT